MSTQVTEWYEFATLLFDTETLQYALAFRGAEYRLQRYGEDLERDAKGADAEIFQLQLSKNSS